MKVVTRVSDSYTKIYNGSVTCVVQDKGRQGVGEQCLCRSSCSVKRIAGDALDPRETKAKCIAKKRQRIADKAT